VKQPAKEIVLSPIPILTRVWGTKTEVKDISKIAKFQRKKYIGVWRR
jgi:hypothetical protein